jgi:hypothetical protein
MRTESGARGSGSRDEDDESIERLREGERGDEERWSLTQGARE